LLANVFIKTMTVDDVNMQFKSKYEKN